MSTDLPTTYTDAPNPEDLLEQIAAGISVVGADGRISYVNPAWSALQDLPPTAILGKPLNDSFVQLYDEDDAIERLLRLAREGGQPVARLHLLRSDGSDVPVLSSFAPGSDPGAVIVMVQAMVLNHEGPNISLTPVIQNTDRQTNDLVLGAKADGTIYSVNRGWLEAMGYTTEEVTDLQVSDFIRPDMLSGYQACVDELRHGRQLVPVETVFVTRDGVNLPVDGYMAAVYADNQLISMHGMFHDVSERIRMQKELRDQRALAEALRDSATALNSSLDIDVVLDHILHSVEHVVPNDAAAVLLINGEVAFVSRSRGFDRYELASDIHRVRLPYKQIRYLREVLDTGEPVVISHIVADDWDDMLGELAYFHSYAAAPIRITDEIIGFLMLLSETPGNYQRVHTERLRVFANQAGLAIRNARLYERLARGVDELQERNDELNAFSHTVAHDLRSPLQVVLGYANLLVNEYSDEYPAEIRAALVNIEGYAVKMQTMIESLLLLAGMRGADIEVGTVNMAELVESVLDRYALRLSEQGIKVEVSAELPPVQGYAPWLEEVLANLVENAIKYIGYDNSQPHIHIRAASLGDVVRYEVADNGLGIPPESQEHLFEMFTRFHKHSATGTGIGLSIVKRVVERLGGRIGVDSTPGEGSTFWIELPAAPAAGAPAT